MFALHQRSMARKERIISYVRSERMCWLEHNDRYRAIGGTDTCRKLSAAFYSRVASDSILRPLFPGKTLRCAIEQLAAFLAQLFGGPPEDALLHREGWIEIGHEL